MIGDRRMLCHGFLFPFSPYCQNREHCRPENHQPKMNKQNESIINVFLQWFVIYSIGSYSLRTLIKKVAQFKTKINALVKIFQFQCLFSSIRFNQLLPISNTSVSDPSHFDFDPDPDPRIFTWEKGIQILGSTFP